MRDPVAELERLRRVEHLRPADLAAIDRLFRAGLLADLAQVDWLATEVLGAVLVRTKRRAELARGLAAWRDAESAWQRRAACLALAELAAGGDAVLPGLCALALGVCAVVVWSPDRLDQTAVARLLRELSRAEPARVEAWFRRWARLMSREGARAAVARLPAARRQELLAHHRRATTLRRR